LEADIRLKIISFTPRSMEMGIEKIIVEGFLSWVYGGKG
jgi:hypothetical protein